MKERLFTCFNIDNKVPRLFSKPFTELPTAKSKFDKIENFFLRNKWIWHVKKKLFVQNLCENEVTNTGHDTLIYEHNF